MRSIKLNEDSRKISDFEYLNFKMIYYKLKIIEFILIESKYNINFCLNLFSHK